MVTQQISGRRRVGIQKFLGFLGLFYTEKLESATASQAEASVWALCQRDESPSVLELIAHYWGKVIILK